jgi:hypothetical protein
VKPIRRRAVGIQLIGVSSFQYWPVDLFRQNLARLIRVITGSSPRPSGLSLITTDRLTSLLSEYVHKTGASVDLLLESGRGRNRRLTTGHSNIPFPQDGRAVLREDRRKTYGVSLNCVSR